MSRIPSSIISQVTIGRRSMQANERKSERDCIKEMSFSG